MSVFNFDNSNRRIKNLLSAEFLFMREKVESKRAFLKDDIEELYNHFHKTAEELNKIDSNLTETKLLVSAEVKVRDFIENSNTNFLDLDNLTSNQIRYYLDYFTMAVNNIPEGESILEPVFETIWTTAFLCKRYLDNLNISNVNLFEEVEKKV